MHLTKLKIMHLKIVSFKYCNDIYFLANFGLFFLNIFQISIIFIFISYPILVPFTHPLCHRIEVSSLILLPVFISLCNVHIYTYIEITKLFMLKILSQLNA